MFKKVLLAKLHRATVTDRDIKYEGSITIDEALMGKADIKPFDDVEIYNINNGARFNTYVIPGTKGEIKINGAASRLVEKKDRVIICLYGYIDRENEVFEEPKLINLDENNEVKKS